LEVREPRGSMIWFRSPLPLREWPGGCDADLDTTGPPEQNLVYLGPLSLSLWLTSWNRRCDHIRVFLDGYSVWGRGYRHAGRTEAAFGAGGNLAIHLTGPRKTRGELAQPSFTVANPEARSGSFGASTVSFFTLTFCQKPVKNAGNSPTDSHSVTFEHPLIRNLVTAAPEDLRCPSFFQFLAPIDAHAVAYLKPRYSCCSREIVQPHQ